MLFFKVGKERFVVDEPKKRNCWSGASSVNTAFLRDCIRDCILEMWRSTINWVYSYSVSVCMHKFHSYNREYNFCKNAENEDHFQKCWSWFVGTFRLTLSLGTTRYSLKKKIWKSYLQDFLLRTKKFLKFRYSVAGVWCGMDICGFNPTWDSKLSLIPLSQTNLCSHRNHVQRTGTECCLKRKSLFTN